MTIATGDSVSIEYTGRLDDGTVFDTSRESVATETGLADAQSEREYAPLTVDVGAGQVVEGLEETLIGLERGDTSTVTVPPEKGYGEWTERRVQEYDPEEFRQMIGGQIPDEGARLRSDDGGVAQLVHVGEDVVRVDFNPVLAGETLEFEIEIVAVD